MVTIEYVNQVTGNMESVHVTVELMPIVLAELIKQGVTIQSIK